MPAVFFVVESLILGIYFGTCILGFLPDVSDRQKKAPAKGDKNRGTRCLIGIRRPLREEKRETHKTSNE
jgi:hypothetical protein